MEKELFYIRKDILKTTGLSVLAKMILQNMIVSYWFTEEDYPTSSLEHFIEIFGEPESRVMNAITELMQHDLITDYIGYKKAKNGRMIYKWGINFKLIETLWQGALKMPEKLGE